MPADSTRTARASDRPRDRQRQRQRQGLRASASKPKPADLAGCLGFAIERTEFDQAGAVVESYWMRSIKRFQDKDQGLPPGTPVSTADLRALGAGLLTPPFARPQVSRIVCQH